MWCSRKSGDSSPRLNSSQVKSFATMLRNPDETRTYRIMNTTGMCFTPLWEEVSKEQTVKGVWVTGFPGEKDQGEHRDVYVETLTQTESNFDHFPLFWTFDGGLRNLTIRVNEPRTPRSFILKIVKIKGHGVTTEVLTSVLVFFFSFLFERFDPLSKGMSNGEIQNWGVVVDWRKQMNMSTKI